MSGNAADNDKDKEKKPWVKPVLDSAIVYEASGKTCCKLTNATCDTSSKNSLGKTHRANTTS